VPIVLIATITPQPEATDVVLAAIQACIPAVQAEPGCELYALHSSKDALVLIEQWSDGDALKTHGQGPAMAQLMAAVEGKLAKPFDISMVRPIPTGTRGQGQLA
jgi:quinol monooxygenase YgiN